jgi:hypothetical protein
MTASRIKESPGGIARRLGRDAVQEQRLSRLARHILARVEPNNAFEGEKIIVKAAS